jgi:uncharacterized membrane protein
MRWYGCLFIVCQYIFAGSRREAHENGVCTYKLGYTLVFTAVFFFASYKVHKKKQNGLNLLVLASTHT